MKSPDATDPTVRADDDQADDLLEATAAIEWDADLVKALGALTVNGRREILATMVATSGGSPSGRSE